MSKSTISKASVILVGLFLLAISVYPVFAEEGITLEESKRIKPLQPIKNNATNGANFKNQLIKQRVEDKVASIKEKIASREAALRTKLQAFKDRKKAEIADRINTNLNKINQNQAEQMQKHLNRMSAILDKLEARVNQNKPDIKDPPAARAAIASARTTIATASSAVQAQALKDYTIQVTTEGRARLDAKAMRDKLHRDILALRKIVIDTKQAVANAIRVAKSGRVVDGPGSNEASSLLRNKEGTSSGR